MTKNGRTTQAANRPERHALRWLLAQSLTYRRVYGDASNTFDVYVAGFSGSETYLGRVGQSSYGDMGTTQPQGLKWDWKFADDVLARQPWQSGGSRTQTKEMAAYHLLPEAI